MEQLRELFEDVWRFGHADVDAHVHQPCARKWRRDVLGGGEPEQELWVGWRVSGGGRLECLECRAGVSLQHTLRDRYACTEAIVFQPEAFEWGCDLCGRIVQVDVDRLHGEVSRKAVED